MTIIKTKTKCPECGSKLKKVLVSIWKFRDKAKSRQCVKCDYYEFDPVQKKQRSK